MGVVLAAQNPVGSQASVRDGGARSISHLYVHPADEAGNEQFAKPRTND